MRLITKLSKSVFIITALSSASQFSVAEELIDCSADCVGVWTSSIEFGYVAFSGNKETKSLNSRFALSYEIEKWRHAGFVSAQTSSASDQATDSEKYTAQAKSDYQYSKSAYSFGIIDYDNTKLSGFDYQASIAVGIGYRFLNQDAHKLKGEMGFGTRKSKDEITFETNSESITRLAGLYKWKISKTSSFEQTVSYEVGDENKIAKSYSGLSANINDDLALKVSYTAKHQSDVPVGNKKLETITSFTVVYNF
jgi:putative salt-induced outer membrane protein